MYTTLKENKIKYTFSNRRANVNCIVNFYDPGMLECSGLTDIGRISVAQGNLE